MRYEHSTLRVFKSLEDGFYNLKSYKINNKYIYVLISKTTNK